MERSYIDWITLVLYCSSVVKSVLPGENSSAHQSHQTTRHFICRPCHTQCISLYCHVTVALWDTTVLSVEATREVYSRFKSVVRLVRLCMPKVWSVFGNLVRKGLYSEALNLCDRYSHNLTFKCYYHSYSPLSMSS